MKHEMSYFTKFGGGVIDALSESMAPAKRARTVEIERSVDEIADIESEPEKVDEGV